MSLPVHSLCRRASAALLMLAALAGCGGGGSDGADGPDPVPPEFTTVYGTQQAGMAHLRLGGDGSDLSGPLAALSSFALTPDGASVVLLARRQAGGPMRLYRIDLARPQVLNVLHPAPVAGGEVARFELSPDGTRVAFSGDLVQDGRDDIFVVGVDGSDPHGIRPAPVTSPVVAGSAELPRGAWSGNGRYLAYLEQIESTGRPWAIYTHDTKLASPNAFRELSLAVPSVGRLGQLAWVGSAAEFVSLADTNGFGHFRIFHKVVRGAAQLIDHPDDPGTLNGSVREMIVDPACRCVLFAATAAAGSATDLVHADLSGATPVVRRLGGPRSAPGTEGVQAVHLDIAGGRVFYAADEAVPGRIEPHVIDIAGGTPGRLGAALPSGWIAADLTLAPGGQTLVYRARPRVTPAGTTIADLFAVRLADPTRSTRLNGTATAGGGVAEGVRAGPDGRGVVYRGDLEQRGRVDLYYSAFELAGAGYRLNEPTAAVDAYAAP
ncbi:MAG: PD40 domain-containing protein [Piscinibacter sp.]|nr:PD40 domain-containing protein [Piscinibacter sp.]